MKKTIAFLCLAALLLSLLCMVSCGSKSPLPANTEENSDDIDDIIDTGNGDGAAQEPDGSQTEVKPDPDGSKPVSDGSEPSDGGTNDETPKDETDVDGNDSALPPYNGPVYSEKTPAIYIETENGSSVPANKQEIHCLVSLRSSDRKQCTDNLPATIRTRGNGSLSAAVGVGKLPYKLKFRNEINPFSLGDGKANDWVLLDHVGDHSMLRNYAARLLGDLLEGIPYSTNSMLVNVVLNGNYVGVYELAEQVEVGKHRVNVNDKLATAENGFLVELDSYASELYVSVGGQKYTVKSKVYSDAQLDFIRDRLQEAEDAIYSGDPVRIAELLDVNSLVDMYIVQEYAKNIDAGWSSFYMYRDVGGKLTFAPPWDFDLSFGNDDRLDGGDYQRLYVGSGRGMMQDHRWYNQLYKQDWFRKAVKERWQEVSKRIIPTLIEDVKLVSFEAASAMQKNYAKWNILGRKCHQEPAQIYRLTSYKQHVDYLIDWMKNRKTWLDSEWK